MPVPCAQSRRSSRLGVYGAAARHVPAVTLHQPSGMHPFQTQRSGVVVNLQGAGQLSDGDTAHRCCEKRNDRRITRAAIAPSRIAMREPGRWLNVRGCIAEFIVGAIVCFHEPGTIGRPRHHGHGGRTVQLFRNSRPDVAIEHERNRTPGSSSREPPTKLSATHEVRTGRKE